MLKSVTQCTVLRCFRSIQYTLGMTVNRRNYLTVLGIETSCDDTGAAVVDEFGNVIGDVLHSQHQIHLDNGGIIPTLAKHLHLAQISNVIDTTLKKSNMTLMDISAIATTVKPGLIWSLLVGLNHSKKLVQECGKPFIPIHHMEAHALVVRMVELVEFPFLVLLASGGHCQIAVVKNIDEFLLLGTALDNAPGEALDKIARRLKVKNLPQCSSMSGGQAIEYLAKNGDPLAYDLALSLWKYRDCNFSFSSVKTQALKMIEKHEAENDIVADGIIPDLNNVCASVQHSVTRCLMRSVQRAMMFCKQTELIPENRRTLVFSGGVACNSYIRTALEKLCHYEGWKLACPPPKLCNDNGVMIAWNGMECLKAGIGIRNIEEVNVESRCPLGKDISQDVINASIKVQLFPYHKYDISQSEDNDEVDKSKLEN